MSILFNTIKKLAGSGRRSAPAPSNSMSSVDKIRQQEGGGIICFAAGSEGDALANLTRELIQPVANRSSKVWFLDVNNQNWRDALQQALQEPVWFAFSFFAIGQDINVEIGGCSVNVWDAYGIPFFRIFGDTPAYFPDRHIRKFSNSINGYGDRSHLEFYKRWFDDRAFAALLPSLSLECKPLDEIDEDIKVNGNIIFPKNGNPPNALQDYWRTSLPDTVAKALELVAESCTSQAAINDELHIDDRLIRCYQDKGIDIAADRPLLCFMVAQVDDYVRRVKSTMVAEAILDLPVIIQGVSWGHVNFFGKKARLDMCSDYAKTSTMFDTSLAMIDMSANTVHAPHDRISRATGHATAFLTNQQEFIGKIIQSPLDCAFRFDKNSIHDLVEHYVLNPREAVSLGLQQARGFRDFFTADRYANALLSAVDAMSLRLNGRPYGTQNFVDFPPKDFR